MFKTFLSKLLTLYIFLIHPRIPAEYRYFIRFYYIGKFKQLKYFWKDYIVKQPYKIISYNGEFQQELLFVLPFVYWHYKNGTLLRTEGVKFTNPFYFFSPKHVEKFEQRNWEGIIDTSFPNCAHNLKFNWGKWLPVPWKEYFQNQLFQFQKPVIVIANRYNTEWGGPPISYLSIEMLQELFDLLQPHFQIVYNRPRSQHIANDNSEVLDLNEHAWITKNYPDVILMDKLFDIHRDSVQNFNHLQLLVYANVEKFISVHGGTAALASCFGGSNIIYSVQGHEHYLKEFETIFPRLSGAEILHAKTGKEVINFARRFI